MTDSPNLDLVRSIIADWERGDFSRVDWADPHIEFVLGDGPDPGKFLGVRAMGERWREQLRPWEDLTVGAGRYWELDEDRILVFQRFSGRGKTSGAIAETKVVNLFEVNQGKVQRLVLYWDRDRAFADLGLNE